MATDPKRLEAPTGPLTVRGVELTVRTSLPIDAFKVLEAASEAGRVAALSRFLGELVVAHPFVDAADRPVDVGQFDLALTWEILRAYKAAYGAPSNRDGRRRPARDAYRDGWSRAGRVNDGT